MQDVNLVVKLQCLVEEIYGIIVNATSGSITADDALNRSRRRSTRRESVFSKTIRIFHMSNHFSVGVPEITEDQFFDDFSCISQIQAKKRGHINKEVSKIEITKVFNLKLLLSSPPQKFSMTI